MFYSPNNQIQNFLQCVNPLEFMPTSAIIQIKSPHRNIFNPGININNIIRMCIHFPFLEVSIQHNPKKKNKFTIKGNIYNKIIKLNKFNYCYMQ